MKRLMLSGWFAVVLSGAALAGVMPIGTSTGPTNPSPCPPEEMTFSSAARHCPIELF